MEPRLDWGSWFAVSLPVSGISIILIWGMLLWSYRPARSPDGEGNIEIKQIRPTREPFTHKQWWVSIVCLVTIALWCVAHAIEDYIGDMGIIAIIPIVAFFSTGVLKKVRNYIDSTYLVAGPVSTYTFPSIGRLRTVYVDNCVLSHGWHRARQRSNV